MKIFNIRACFANNSSSSHSLIFLPKGETVMDNYSGDFDFGWGDFTLASSDAKADYFKQILLQNLNHSIDWDNNAGRQASLEFVRNLFDDPDMPDNGDIDHQSSPTLPVNLNHEVNMEFFHDMYKHIVDNPRIVILGGNDNSDSHPLRETYEEYYGPFNDLPTDAGRDTKVIAEKFDDYWVVINNYNGHRVRFSFDPDAVIPTKSSVPELVDVKITDFCPFNCEFCYQGSTVNGKHASLETINLLAQELKDKRVFEIALGGGEPTMHPQFIEILKAFHDKNLVTNFTTKSTKWLKDIDYLREILTNCNSFAYSVRNLKELEEFESLVTDLNSNRDKTGLTFNIRYTVQVVLQTIPKEEFESILKFCKEHWIDIVLLGFKNTHRGERYEKIDDYYWLFQTVRELDMRKVGMDTIAIQQYEQELKLLEISDKFYSAKDGSFSCYIDAVSGTIAPSSYCDVSEFKQFNPDTWVDIYKGF